MDTNIAKSEIVLATKKIDITQKIFADFDAKDDKSKQKSWFSRHKRVVISSIVIFLLCFCLCRIPYTGAYIDDFFFEYLFGFGKYFLYIWGIIICFFIIFKKSIINKIARPANIVLQVFTLLAVCLVFSALTHWVHYLKGSDSDCFTGFVVNLREYHTNHFWPYVTHAGNSAFYPFIGNDATWWMNTYLVHNGQYYVDVSGGLIGEFFASISYLFVIIFSTLVVLFCIDFFIAHETSSDKGTILQRIYRRIIDGSTYSNERKRLNRHRGDVKVPTTSDATIAMCANTQEDTPPISFLTDTSIDHYQENKVYSENIIKQIKEFNDSYHLDIKYEKSIVMPLFTEIYWLVDQQETTDQFIKNEIAISKYTKLNEFNISFKQNQIRFEYLNQKPSKVSIKSILSANSIKTNDTNAIIGIAYANSPLTLNFAKHGSILLLGAKGSGVNMLLSSILLSYAYLNAPKTTTIDIIAKDENVITNNFMGLPHVNNVSTIEIVGDNIGNVIKQYHDEIERRKQIFAKHDIDQFHTYQKMLKNNTEWEVLKTQLLVFCDFDQITRDNIGYIPTIKKILTEGKQYGIHLILIANEVTYNVIDQAIFNEIGVKLVLKMNNENESLQIFDNYRGYQLYGNGDGYYFEKKSAEKIRFQTCYLNQNELIETINIIKKFNEQKGK